MADFGQTDFSILATFSVPKKPKPLRPNLQTPNPERGDPNTYSGFGLHPPFLAVLVLLWVCLWLLWVLLVWTPWTTLRQTTRRRTPSAGPPKISLFPSPTTTKRPHFRPGRFKKPPKFHEKTLRETQKEPSGGGRGKNRVKFWAPHPSGPYPSGAHPSGPRVCSSCFFEENLLRNKTPIWAKVGLAKVGQLRLAKVGLAKVCQKFLAKVGLAKVGLAKVGQIRMAKVGLAKVCISHSNSRS